MKKIIKAIMTFTGGLMIIGSLAFFIYMYFAAEILTTHDRLEKSDAIVVLGGSFYRPFYAADLYKKGFAPRIYCSRPYVPDEVRLLRSKGIKRRYQWEILREILIEEGVPANSINFFGTANVSTADEAEQLRTLLGKSGIKHGLKLIVVTSPLHTFRAGLIFRATFPESTIIMAGETYDKPPSKWWTDFRSARFVVLETAKLFFYTFGGSFKSSSSSFK